MLRVLASVGFVGVVLVACGSSAPDIRASDYDQTCTSASDCAVIQEGSGCCGCGNAAINKKDLTRYQADAKRRREACGGKACAVDCQISTPTCVAGTCSVCHTSTCGSDAGTDASIDASSDASDAQTE